MGRKENSSEGRTNDAESTKIRETRAKHRTRERERERERETRGTTETIEIKEERGK